MSHKVAIGTVQFGLQYGIANARGKVPTSEVREILACGRRYGLDTLDTAIAYGDSESSLGAAGVDDWQVVTKLPALPANTTDVAGWVESEVHGSLNRLRLPRLSTVLLHRSADVIGPQAVDYQRALDHIKQTGLCQAVGVSIYAPNELDAIWQHPTGWKPDLVQAPFNVLDRRLQSSGWMQKLQQSGVRLHTRSAFLQGLLLMPAERRPAWFAPWKPLLDDWQAWCAEQQVSPLQAAIQFACGQHEVECVVFGVDTTFQLQEILNCMLAPTPLVPTELCSDDINLVDPSRWKLS